MRFWKLWAKLRQRGSLDWMILCLNLITSSSNLLVELLLN
jgi:hypothetical protein